MRFIMIKYTGMCDITDDELRTDPAGVTCQTAEISPDRDAPHPA